MFHTHSTHPHMCVCVCVRVYIYTHTHRVKVEMVHSPKAVEMVSLVRAIRVMGADQSAIMY